MVACSPAVTKFCIVAELFDSPLPLMFNISEAGTLTLNALAPGLNTTLLTCVVAEMETEVILEISNVAVSEGPLGTVAGVQLAAVFQSLLIGFRFQVALSA